MQTVFVPRLAGIHGLGADVSAANQSNPSSPWAGLFSSLGTAAINIGGAYASRELGINIPAGGTPPAATQQPTTAAAVGGSNWIMPAVILGGVFLFFMMNKRR